ncbi:MAG: phosphatidate cytidylyltransferase [Lachnospiraceae bacterium]|jgi:phosphatidate cytidylyltransferase|nr:phosphatidate cytidylyltransferase [Lachnospiraceae bacterium]
MFRTRLLSGAVLIIVLAAAIYFGEYTMFGLTAVLSLSALYEFNKTTGNEFDALSIVGYILGIIYYALLVSGVFLISILTLLAAIVCFFAMMAVYVLKFPKFNFSESTIKFFGFFYCILLFSYMYLSASDFGGYLVILIFIGAWGSDTFAYCVGMLLGKHRLAPVLSPKKSIEGAIGGVMGAAILGYVYALLFASHITDLNVNDKPWLFAVICAGASIISQIGDLAASGIKRNSEIKDFGKLIPGHGGILDRFDSVIFTAPVVYLLAFFLMR